MFELQNKRVFVTGGTGFFGKSILAMLRRGFLSETEFVILSRNPNVFLENNPEFQGLPNVRYTAGDVRDFSFPNEPFDAILHAATPALKTMTPGEQRSIILEGTRRVLLFAEKCGVSRLMITSSGAVYGPQPNEIERIPEDYPCRPATEYGIAKLETEALCVDSGIPTLLPRCFAFVGPYLNRNIHFAIGNFIRDALSGEPIIIQGDGTPLRSYLYADDLVEWLFAIFERGESGVPYNVGSDKAVCIADLARTVKRVFDSKSEIKILTSPIPGTAPPRYVPSIDRAKHKLNLCVKHSLEEAILKSV